MFENLNNLAARLPPEVSLRVLTIAMEFSDLPNKDEIAEQIRKITGDRDTSKPMTPEEEAAAQEQAAAQTEAMQLQREAARAALAEQQAKVREINARAAKLEAEVAAMGANAQSGMQQELMSVRSQAAAEMDRLSGELRKAQADLANRTVEINREADTALEVARIDADAKARVAQIQAVSDQKLQGIEQRLTQMELATRSSPSAKDKKADAPSMAR
jgi:DNA repair exonuclease SbcCD ATPase subunit